MPTKKHRRHQHVSASSDSSVSSIDTSPPVSGTEPIILVLASWDYPPIVTAPASPFMDQDTKIHKGEHNLYLEPTCLRTYKPTTKIHKGEHNLYLEPAEPRQPNPTTVRLALLQVRETSPDGSMDRNTGDTEQPR